MAGPSARLLLLDEPFRGVDLGARADIGRRLRASREGRATLVASADIDELLEIADRIVVLHDGAIVHDGPMAGRRPRAPRPPRGGRRGDGRRDGRSSSVRRGWLFALILGLIAFFTLTQPAFASVANGFAILRGISIVTIIACAVTISLVVAGFDLSVGANAGLAMMLSAISLVIFELDAPSAIAIALIGGFLVGSLNVLLIVRFGIPDLLATLATLFVVQGFQLVITGGRSVATGFRLPDGSAATGVFTPEFLASAAACVGPVPAPVVLTAGVVIALQAFLTATRTVASSRPSAPTRRSRTWRASTSDGPARRHTSCRACLRRSAAWSSRRRSAGAT